MNKTPIAIIFDDWLTLMERAYEVCTKEQFRELENKILHEIVAARSRRRGKRD